ncbi:MAG TPA: glycosyltransferase family 4 protein [Lacipirellulaceae bacterium]|nr:glycosyltransferase family 4 protein [Lacipirellulaceae bacterium]
MRVLVHDYCGHPFQVQLSRALAARGHDVLHLYNGSFQTPRGALAKRGDDAPGFDVGPIDLGEMVPKTGFRRRLQLEIKYGRLLTEACDLFAPDVVLAANTPSIPQRRLVRHCRRRGIRHYFWVQDIYGIAAYSLLKRRIPVLGHAVGRYFMHLDRQSARGSDALVVITDDFRPVFEGWGVPSDRIHVVHNWSPLDELPQRPRDNPWATEQGLEPGPRFLYSGTLAMKHNPALLLELGKLFDLRGAGEMIVISEGPGVEWLQREAAAAGVRRLRLLPFQPFDRLPEVQGAADVLVAILEPDAGIFSVPSKVLSYMCAGRAILGAMPQQNLAARTIVQQGAGVVVDPADSAGFRAAAEAMLEHPERLAAYGAAARRYAEQHFDIARIADRFEPVLAK